MMADASKLAPGERAEARKMRAAKQCEC